MFDVIEHISLHHFDYDTKTRMPFQHIIVKHALLAFTYKINTIDHVSIIYSEHILGLSRLH